MRSKKSPPAMGELLVLVAERRYAAWGNSCRQDCFRLTFLSLDLLRSPRSSFSMRSSMDL